MCNNGNNHLQIFYFSSFSPVHNFRLLLVYSHYYSSVLFFFLWDYSSLYSLIYFIYSDHTHLLEAQKRLSHVLTSRHLMTYIACFSSSKLHGLEFIGDPQHHTPLCSHVSLPVLIPSPVQAVDFATLHLSLPVHGTSRCKCLPIPSPPLFFPSLPLFDMAKSRPLGLPVQLGIVYPFMAIYFLMLTF